MNLDSFFLFLMNLLVSSIMNSSAVISYLSLLTKESELLTNDRLSPSLGLNGGISSSLLTSLLILTVSGVGLINLLTFLLKDFDNGSAVFSSSMMLPLYSKACCKSLLKS